MIHNVVHPVYIFKLFISHINNLYWSNILINSLLVEITNHSWITVLDAFLFVYEKAYCFMASIKLSVQFCRTCMQSVDFMNKL